MYNMHKYVQPCFSAQLRGTSQAGVRGQKNSSLSKCSDHGEAHMKAALRHIADVLALLLRPGSPRSPSNVAHLGPVGFLT